MHVFPSLEVEGTDFCLQNVGTKSKESCEENTQVKYSYVKDLLKYSNKDFVLWDWGRIFHFTVETSMAVFLISQNPRSPLHLFQRRVAPLIIPDGGFA